MNRREFLTVAAGGAVAASLAVDHSLTDLGAVPHAELVKRLEAQDHVVA